MSLFIPKPGGSGPHDPLLSLTGVQPVMLGFLLLVSLAFFNARCFAMNITRCPARSNAVYRCLAELTCTYNNTCACNAITICSCNTGSDFNCPVEGPCPSHCGTSISTGTWVIIIVCIVSALMFIYHMCWRLKFQIPQTRVPVSDRAWQPPKTESSFPM